MTCFSSTVTLLVRTPPTAALYNYIYHNISLVQLNVSNLSKYVSTFLHFENELQHLHFLLFDFDDLTWSKFQILQSLNLSTDLYHLLSFFCKAFIFLFSKSIENTAFDLLIGQMSRSWHKLCSVWLFVKKDWIEGSAKQWIDGVISWCPLALLDCFHYDFAICHQVGRIAVCCA